MCLRVRQMVSKALSIEFPVVSVGATENLLMAAALAQGQTVLKNAAREPEIGDLARCLIAMGARISGVDSGTLVVEGVKELRGASHAVLPDRIETGTYAIATAIAGGEVELTEHQPAAHRRAGAAAATRWRRAGTDQLRHPGGAQWPQHEGHRYQHRAVSRFSDRSCRRNIWR